MAVSPDIQKQILAYQRNEITEHHIYLRLSQHVKQPENRRVLLQMAADELQHHWAWKQHTQQDVRPSRFKIWKYVLLSRILGLTFGLKLMERGEVGAQGSYLLLREAIPEVVAIVRDEGQHEAALLALLDEERLRYTSSIVLGLNDALVELTGALAGFTLALQNTKLIALTGSITGIAAALSMSASEYLSIRSDTSAKNPGRAALYTGVAYVATVILLILPYLLITNFYIALACTLVLAVAIIAFFTYYMSVARELPFRARFLEMSGVSLGVAALSFGIGLVLRLFFNISV